MDPRSRSHFAYALAVALLAPGFAAYTFHALPAEAGEVEVVVRGARTGDAPVRLAAFASAEAFEADRLFVGVQGPPAPDGSRVLRLDLPPGDYALAAYQDLDRDDRLTTGFAGIPREPYGFSNGARGLFGPPDFDDVRVTVSDAPLRLEIELE